MMTPHDPSRHGAESRERPRSPGAAHARSRGGHVRRRAAHLRASWRRRAAQVAGGLQAMGINPGDHVALSCPNVPWFPIAYFGILKAGAVVVPLNVLLKPREIAYHLKDSDAKAMMAFEGTAELPMAAMAKAACDEAACAHLVIVTRDAAAPSPIAGAPTLAALDARSAGDVRYPPPAPRRHGGHPLHLRHDRSAEGRRADARQHGAQRHRLARHVPAGRRAAASSRMSRSSRCRSFTRPRRPAR